MGLLAALQKWKMISSLAADKETRRLLRALFFQRYQYPGTGPLRAIYADCYALPEVTLKIKAPKPITITLRPSDMGDVASFFENWFESEAPKLPHKPHALIVDAGAHIGTWSVRTASILGDCRIVAFEPNPKNASLLEKNLKALGVTFEIHKAALWSQSGEIRFTSDESNAGRIGDGLTVVAGITLADALGPRIREIDYLKMDIEGAEYQVLDGILPLLPDQCRVYIEVHDANHQRATFEEILQNAGWASILADRSYPPHEMHLLQKGRMT